MANRKKRANSARGVTNRSGNRDERLMQHIRTEERQGQHNRTQKRRAGSPVTHHRAVTPDSILWTQLAQLVRQVDLMKLKHKLAEVNQIVEQINVLLRQLNGIPSTHHPPVSYFPQLQNIVYPQVSPGANRTSHVYHDPHSPIQQGTLRTGYHHNWPAGRVDYSIRSR
ncbi:hypothetical protein CathTA2_2841 [Caldalkalibacillus thermarum TA2.A1]|uniref:Uncharacterized protein n=1 Tax=Caldalkalibacillus thermarum (strain TA2.A1) TaxID=986075 RepID=F5LAA6_CALTT|nr:hypothetical protein [Caldalkalibacillus thermarum]EGL81655.1 hypothetical protein CathTA2_2841 [Caldalkalibacillus thermarum TA2.A1]QZT33252.1 hypothetical protein HUR95_13275 [Caldalkalibacillus thermarum TA2.A1]